MNGFNNNNRYIPTYFRNNNNDDIRNDIIRLENNLNMRTELIDRRLDMIDNRMQDIINMLKTNKNKDKRKRRQQPPEEDIIKTIIIGDEGETIIDGNIMEIDDSKDKKSPLNSGLGLLGSILTLMDKGKGPDKKEEEVEVTSDDDTIIEYDSEEEFEELDFKIESLDDLLRLSDYYEELIDNSEEEKSDSVDKETMFDKMTEIANKDEDDSICVINDKRYSIDLKKVHEISGALTKLKNMIGLEEVKQLIVDMIVYYLQHFEKKNKAMLHTVIEGPPGVGKTELGRILAEIYAGLGIIKSDKFKIVRRTDLVGEYLGHTAHKTQKVIDEAEGGVLFIDEAYALGNEDKRDSFSKECIDTLNQNLSENKKKLIVIIAGYPDELDRCFFSYNPGLRRRFPFRYVIESYTSEELRDIFLKKLNDIDFTLNEKEFDFKDITNFFSKNMESFKYYGGDIDNLLINCKFAHARRIACRHPSLRRKFTKKDIEKGFERFVNNKQSSNNSVLSYYT